MSKSEDPIEIVPQIVKAGIIAVIGFFIIKVLIQTLF